MPQRMQEFDIHNLGDIIQKHQHHTYMRAWGEEGQPPINQALGIHPIGVPLDVGG